MSKPTAAVKNRYAAKVYDRVALIVPKGRKDDLQDYATEHGESVNGLINRLLREVMGMDESQWHGIEDQAE